MISAETSPGPVPVQGIILLGGQGTRMRPATPRNKHLLPIAGRPMADYGLELMARCGIGSITAVIRPDDDAAFRAAFAASEWGGHVEHIVHQPAPAGTADALARCAEVITAAHVATLWGDNLFEQAPAAMLSRYFREPTRCMLAVTESTTPQYFGNVVLDGDRITTIVDKPAVPVSTTVTTGFMLFEPASLFTAVGDVPIDSRGERDTMQAVRRFAAAGQVGFHRITGRWFDAAVSPQFLGAAELFALRRGFNHLSTEEFSWTCTTPPTRSGSISTQLGDAS